MCRLYIYVSALFDSSMVIMTGYRNDYNASLATDTDNATCQQVTESQSAKAFVLRAELPPVNDSLTLTLELDGGDCLGFPATMVYTEGGQSAMLPFRNNPSYCDPIPEQCVFRCDCGALQCQTVTVLILSARNYSRGLCEIYIN